MTASLMDTSALRPTAAIAMLRCSLRQAAIADITYARVQEELDRYDETGQP